jgi:hypothetical protein
MYKQLLTAVLSYAALQIHPAPITQLMHTATLRVARWLHELCALLLPLLLHFIRRPWQTICPTAKADHLPVLTTELVVPSALTAHSCATTGRAALQKQLLLEVRRHQIAKILRRKPTLNRSAIAKPTASPALKNKNRLFWFDLIRYGVWPAGTGRPAPQTHHQLRLAHTHTDSVTYHISHITCNGS